MFVRCKKRFKDGKEHRYWSVVENCRVSGGRDRGAGPEIAWIAAGHPGDL